MLTIEQISEAAGKQPELKTAILSTFKNDFVSGADSQGLVVRTKEQDQQFLDNHVQAVVDGKVNAQLQDKVNTEYGNAMRKIDEEIKAITGIEKNAGEKTTDYAKRAVETKRQGGDPVTKEKVTQLETMLAEQKSTYETKLKQAEENLFNSEIGFGVDTFLSTVNIATPAHLKTDEEKQVYTNQQKGFIRREFLASHKAKKDEQGNIVFYDGSEKPQMSQKDGKPLAAGDIIGSKYSSWFVPVGKSGAGTGTGNDSVVKPEGGFKSSEDIHKFLAANGVVVGTKEYNTQLESLATESKIDL